MAGFAEVNSIPDLTPEKLFRMSHINLNNHDAFYGVGDVHGDMFALLTALQLTGCVQIDRQHFASSGKCWSNPNYTVEVTKRDAPLKNITNTIQWVGNTSVVAFLGDIFDNRRSEHHPENGQCSWSGTQFEMLTILLHLKTQAKQQGGNVIWILGNHDVWNVSPIPTGVCERYGAKKQTCSGHVCSLSENESYVACRNGAFSKQHRDNVRNYMIKMEAVALLKISNGCIDKNLCHFSGGGTEANTHVLALHGGMGKRCEQGTLKSLTSLSRVADLQENDHHMNIIRINMLYLDTIYNHSEDQNRFRTLELPFMPTWCRPQKIDNAAELKTYFGTSKMIKAHDGQRKGANCNGNYSENEQAYDGQADLCFMDVYMSRAFNQRAKDKKEFACIKLFRKNDGRIYRQLMKTYRKLNDNLEYTVVS